MLRYAIATVLAIVPMAPVTSVAGEKSAARPAAPQAAARIMLFNLTPAGTYNVRRIGGAAGTASAGPGGSVI
jgi:hypothetical protein